MSETRLFDLVGAPLLAGVFLLLLARLEQALNLVLVTPRMHGIHHSIVERESSFVACSMGRIVRTIEIVKHLEHGAGRCVPLAIDFAAARPDTRRRAGQ
ncbi:MAG: hypothetical protein HYR51_00125 [Candidatus Rokubacteria bacterium]|nr:hypothetical protein [Candidatus Rokubacteria bacterium]